MNFNHCCPLELSIHDMPTLILDYCPPDDCTEDETINESIHDAPTLILDPDPTLPTTKQLSDQVS